MAVAEKGVRSAAQVPARASIFEAFYNARLAESILKSYQPRRHSRSQYLTLRGLRHHVRTWDADPGGACAGTLVLLHGWMDSSASFQFVVDALARNWRVLAPDWRGYGLTDRAPADCYWFPDYLGDLDQMLDALLPDEPAVLVGHSMGGNVATLYAGVRPQRVRQLVNLEGMGLPRTQPEEAPARYARWLDELKQARTMRDYESREMVAKRLMEHDPRLLPEYAAFVAEHWARPTADGRFELAGDPAHKIVNPTLYRVDEVVACWREVRADVLIVYSGASDRWHAFVQTPEYQERLRAFRSLSTVRIEDSGHMLHHDRPAEVARVIEEFVR
jgi:pimeloyl-ACP methyl ester carboxylesterase